MSASGCDSRLAAAWPRASRHSSTRRSSRSSTTMPPRSVTVSIRFLEALVPFGGDFEEEHDALVGEAELEVAELADVVDEVLGVVDLGGVVVGEGLVAELIEQDGDVGLFRGRLRSW